MEERAVLATVPSATLLGVEGQPVVVEVHVSNGLPGFTVVGLPDAACRESHGRVRAALLSSGLGFPLKRITVNLAPTVLSLVEALKGDLPWPEPPEPPPPPPRGPAPDLAEVRGHALGRLAVEVAAAGGHHLLMVGPPGSGKTMLARRLPGLLPPLPRQQALEATRIWSAAGMQLPAGGLIT